MFPDQVPRHLHVYTELILARSFPHPGRVLLHRGNDFFSAHTLSPFKNLWHRHCLCPITSLNPGDLWPFWYSWRSVPFVLGRVYSRLESVAFPTGDFWQSWLFRQFAPPRNFYFALV